METIWHLRVRAVIEHDGKFLVMIPGKRDRTFLPGGHVETGESATIALIRELKEELGIDGEIEKYLGAIENAWIEDGIKEWEITHFFKFKSPVDTHSIKSIEEGVEIVWLSPAEFEKFNLLPVPLRNFLKDWNLKNQKAWWASSM